jgi:hypothetical protein
VVGEEKKTHREKGKRVQVDQPSTMGDGA